MLRIDPSGLLGLPKGALDQPEMKLIEGKVEG
jgi:hypothetical protein